MMEHALMHPNPKAQKLLDDMKQRSDAAINFADTVLKLVDQFVPAACKELARKMLTDAAMRYGLEIHQTRSPKG